MLANYVGQFSNKSMKLESHACVLLKKKIEAKMHTASLCAWRKKRLKKKEYKFLHIQEIGKGENMGRDQTVNTSNVLCHQRG